jgi:hypothetical protein
MRAWPIRLDYLLLAGSMMMLAIAVQQVLRPAFAGGLLLDVAPSLLYGAGMVYAVLSVRRWPDSYGWWVGAGALLYELLQPWIAERTFDPGDVVATILGVVAAMALRPART